MFTLYILILLSLVVGVIGYIILIYSSKKKQFDDIEAPKYRMLDDDDDDINR